MHARVNFKRTENQHWGRAAGMSRDEWWDASPVSSSVCCHRRVWSRGLWNKNSRKWNTRLKVRLVATCGHISSETALLGPKDRLTIKDSFTCLSSGLIYCISCRQAGDASHLSSHHSQRSPSPHVAMGSVAWLRPERLQRRLPTPGRKTIKRFCF